MMPHRNDPARIIRLRNWILLLTLAPSAVALIVGQLGVAAGVTAGGILVLFNLLGTQRAVSGFLEGDPMERAAAALLWFGKFALTAGIVFVLLYAHWVHPLALLAGLGVLPLSLVFDIFLFPVNKGEAKKP